MIEAQNNQQNSNQQPHDDLMQQQARMNQPVAVAPVFGGPQAPSPVVHFEDANEAEDLEHLKKSTVKAVLVVIVVSLVSSVFFGFGYVSTKTNSVPLTSEQVVSEENGLIETKDFSLELPSSWSTTSQDGVVFYHPDEFINIDKQVITVATQQLLKDGDLALIVKQDPTGLNAKSEFISGFLEGSNLESTATVISSEVIEYTKNEFVVDFSYVLEDVDAVFDVRSVVLGTGKGGTIIIKTLNDDSSGVEPAQVFESFKLK